MHATVRPKKKKKKLNLDQQNFKFSFSILHSGKSLQTLPAKSVALLPVQAVSILQKLVARAEAELSFLALWPQASTHHISQGRRERKSKKSGLVWPMLELVSAESACCLQMRINRSYCLSGTQSTPATLLFSIDHIYGACEPMIDGRMKSTKDLLQASDNFWQRTDFV